MELTGLPKTTIYYHISDIPLSLDKQKEVKKRSVQKLISFNKNKQGRPVRGKMINNPKQWSSDLVLLVSHLTFDGHIDRMGCAYYNRNIVLIERVKRLVKKLFNLESKVKVNSKTGVRHIGYYYVQLGRYMVQKEKDFKKYIENASLNKRKLFLTAFFDDEGSIYFNNAIRRVKGAQKDLEMLELVSRVLGELGIKSKVDKKYGEVIISRKKNLERFQKQINFSEGIYINPNRKNSVWKEKLEKREILARALDSYQS